MHDAVDFGCIRGGTADRTAILDAIDKHRKRATDFLLQSPRTDARLRSHEARAALLFDRGRNGIGQIVRNGALDGRVCEAADAIELRLGDEREQLLEFGFRFARKADDERAANREIRFRAAPHPHTFQHALGRGRAFHQLEDPRACMLERDVEIRQQTAARGVVGHQCNHVIHMRVRINVVQPHPCAVLGGEISQRTRELSHLRAYRAPMPETGPIPNIDAIRARVLRDHEQLLHAGLQQSFGFDEHVADRSAHEIAAHRRDDAKRAAMIATFADLQIGVMLWGELDSLQWNEIDEWIMRLRQMRVHGCHHFVRRMRSCHCEHFRVRITDEFASAFRAQATGDDDFPVLRQRFADGVERFLDGRIDEAAGVDDDEIRAFVRRRNRVTLGAQLGDDPLGIDQGLRASERHKADTRLTRIVPTASDHRLLHQQ